MNDLIKTVTEFLLNEDAPKKQKIAEASGQSDPDITVWTKKGTHNYDAFLAANKDRIGEPMIDGGVKVGKKGSENNGKLVEGVIYCGAGCVLYKDQSGNLNFVKLPTGLINTNDGSVSWSEHRSYNDNSGNGHARVVTEDTEQFKKFAEALAVAAKNV